MIKKEHLPLFLEAVVKAVLPLANDLKVIARVEDNKRAARILLVVSRPKIPEKEIARMAFEFIFVMDEGKNLSIHIDTYIYILTGDLTDSELKHLILLQAMCGFVAYEFLNDSKNKF